MSQRYNDNTKTKVERKSARVLRNLCIFPENSAQVLGSTRECFWDYVARSSPKHCHNFM